MSNEFSVYTNNAENGWNQFLTELFGGLTNFWSPDTPHRAPKKALFTIRYLSDIFLAAGNFIWVNWEPALFLQHSSALLRGRWNVIILFLKGRCAIRQRLLSHLPSSFRSLAEYWSDSNKGGASTIKEIPTFRRENLPEKMIRIKLEFQSFAYVFSAIHVCTKSIVSYPASSVLRSPKWIKRDISDLGCQPTTY